MLALLRLAAFAFLFGLFGVLLYLSVRLLFRAVLPLPAEYPEALAERLPSVCKRKVGKRKKRGRCLLFLRDFFLSFSAFLLLILFLFWQAEGRVRLFVLALVFSGGLLAARLYTRFLLPLEYRVIFLLKYPILFVIRPPLLLLLRIGEIFLGFLRKILAFFIKIMKRCDTVLVSYFYRRRALRALFGRRARRVILAAIAGEEGHRDVG